MRDTGIMVRNMVRVERFLIEVKSMKVNFKMIFDMAEVSTIMKTVTLRSVNGYVTSVKVSICIVTL